MSTYISYAKIFGNIPEDLPMEERKQQWREQAGYMPDQPISKLHELIAEHCKDYAPTKFSKQEQEQRRHRSERMREALLENIVDQHTDLPNMSRWSKRLLDPRGTEQAKRFNERVQALFNTPSNPTLEQYRTKTPEEIRLLHKMRQEGKTVSMNDIDLRPQLRGELLMEIVNQYAQMTPDELAQMANPNLSDEQLVQNFHTLQHASLLMLELDSLVKDPSISLTDEQKQQLHTLRKRQPDFANPRECLLNMANPYYQYLDLDDIRLIDASKIASDPRMDTYNPHEKQECNNLYNFISDISLFQFARIEAAENELLRFGMSKDQDPIARASFKTREQLNQDDVLEIVEEEPTIGEIQCGEVLAFEQGDKACILYADRARGSTRVISDRPGRLFDQSLAEDISALSTQLEDADPALLISSREFKDMKKALKAFSQFGALGDHPTPYQREKMEKELKKLQESTEKYLSTKGPTGKNEREQKRMDAANAIKDFAAHKLQHLGLVEKSQNTLTLEQQREKQAWTGQREGESVAQARERQREENMQRMAQQKETEAQRIKIAAQRQNDPYGWLEQQFASYPETLQSLQGAVKYDIEKLRKTDNRYEINPSDEKINPAKNYVYGRTVIGNMVLMEMLQTERERTPQGQTGPLLQYCQTSFENKEELVQRLGERAIQQQAKHGDITLASQEYEGVQYPLLAYPDLRKMIQTFDPKPFSYDFLKEEQQRAQEGLNEYAEKQKQQEERLQSEQEQQILRDAPPVSPSVIAQCMRSENASGLRLRDFFISNMQDGPFESTRFDALCEQGQNELAHTVGKEMLRDMIVFDMAVQERIGRGKDSPSGPVETMLLHDKGRQQLQNAVEHSKEFVELTTENLNKVRIRELLTGQAPRKVAQQMLQNVKTAGRQAATSAPSVSKQREQNAPVRQAQAPQSRQPIVPLK